jgi:signal peptidase I
MNQNNGAIYFDSDKTIDTLILDPKNELEATGLTEQKNYKKRHKNDVNSMSAFRRIVDTFLPAIVVSFVMYLIFQFVLLNGTVPSGSMESTILTGNLILSNRLAYINETPDKGDVIVFYSEEHEKLLVKRVIGVAGDVIDLKGGEVYINGQRVFESYIQGQTFSASGEDETYVVPAGKLFVMGDNREDSADSRYFNDAFVDVDDVKGEVFLHYSLGGDDGFYAETIKSVAPTFVD